MECGECPWEEEDREVEVLDHREHQVPRVRVVEVVVQGLRVLQEHLHLLPLTRLHPGETCSLLHAVVLGGEDPQI